MRIEKKRRDRGGVRGRQRVKERFPGMSLSYTHITRNSWKSQKDATSNIFLMKIDIFFSIVISFFFARNFDELQNFFIYFWTNLISLCINMLLFCSIMWNLMNEIFIFCRKNICIFIGQVVFHAIVWWLWHPSWAPVWLGCLISSGRLSNWKQIRY